MSDQNILSGHETELKTLIEQHEKTVLDLQAQMEASVKNAAEQIENLVKQHSETYQLADPKQEVLAPLAIWKEAEGEKFLVLNESAANMISGVLDQLTDILPKLQKVIPQSTSIRQLKAVK